MGIETVGIYSVCASSKRLQDLDSSDLLRRLLRAVSTCPQRLSSGTSTPTASPIARPDCECFLGMRGQPSPFAPVFDRVPGPEPRRRSHARWRFRRKPNVSAGLNRSTTFTRQQDWQIVVVVRIAVRIGTAIGDHAVIQ